jgi:hypothetical protein
MPADRGGDLVGRLGLIDELDDPDTEKLLTRLHLTGSI